MFFIILLNTDQEAIQIKVKFEEKPQQIYKRILQKNINNLIKILTFSKIQQKSQLKTHQIFQSIKINLHNKPKQCNQNFTVLNVYGAIMIFDCIYYFELLTNYFKVNYEIIVLQYSNYPVLFQVPQFRYNLNKVCVWLSLMDIVVPGISISYLYRFDKNRNSRVYFIIGLLGLFFGIICWLLGSLLTSEIQLPQSIFVYPLIILFTCLWAIRQDDLRIIWYGQFYDQYLMDNFIVEYNPESSQIALEQSGLHQDQLVTLMKDLKLKSQP